MSESLLSFTIHPLLALALAWLILLGVIALLLSSILGRAKQVHDGTAGAMVISASVAYYCPTCEVVHRGQRCPSCDGDVAVSFHSLWKAGYETSKQSAPESEGCCGMLREDQVSDLHEGGQCPQRTPAEIALRV